MNLGRKPIFAHGAVILLLLRLSCQSIHGQSIVLDFADLGNAAINFTDGGFTFTSPPGGPFTGPGGSSVQFEITGVQNGTGSAIGLDGGLTPNGPFLIGTITSTIVPSVGTVESASVSGSATFFITDPGLLNLTGSIQWVSIATIQAGGFLDLTGSVNLTGITYTGTDPDLIALAAGGKASDTVSFQFAPAETLSALADQTGSGISTSYSGSIGAVPEPSVLSLIAAGVGLLSFSKALCRKAEPIR